MSSEIAEQWADAYERFYAAKTEEEAIRLARETEILQDRLTYDEATDEWNGEPAEDLTDQFHSATVGVALPTERKFI